MTTGGMCAGVHVSPATAGGAVSGCIFASSGASVSVDERGVTLSFSAGAAVAVAAGSSCERYISVMAPIKVPSAAAIPSEVRKRIER